MLTSITLRNIKRHRHSRVNFGRLTVLAGPNGVGKSTVLESIGYVLAAKTRSGEGAARAALTGFNTLGATKSHIRCEAGPYSVSATWNSKDWEFSASKKRGGPASPKSSDSSPVVVHFRLSPEKMRGPSVLTSDIRLSSSGDNLAAVLGTLSLRRDGSLESIERALQSTVPGAIRISTAPAEVSGRGSSVGLFVEFEHVGRVPAAHLSSGTLLALALLTATHVEGLDLLLVDDVEQGLHMGAQQALMQAFRAVQAVHPKLQIVVTTHSPFIMEHAEPAEIVLFGLDDEGHAVAARPDEHPDANRLLEVLSPAELWSCVGEDWIRNVSK